jgi:nitrilase
VSTIIRGVRINLAAAICWESYMPLLRQALYQQNVNLYLAPTADNRDAWLGLMRTVGLEGRCFVVSSNMCIRNSSNDSSHAGGAAVGNRVSTNGASASHSNSSGAAAAAVALAGDPLNGIPDSHPRGSGRRNSCFTEEGFEIALPGAVGGAAGGGVEGDKDAAEAAQLLHHHPTRKERRRSSIIDEDGNEIVLCSPDSLKASTSSAANAIEEEEEEDDDDDDDKPGQTNGAALPRRTATHTATAAVTSPTTAAHHERHSTFGLPSPVSPKAGGLPQAASSGSGGSVFVSRGGSSIVSPFGEVLAGPQWEDEHGLIYADVDFDDCVRGRLDLDVAGSYSRNDSFHFSVDGLDLDPLPYC